jgi:hypothetical protein
VSREAFSGSVRGWLGVDGSGAGVPGVGVCTGADVLRAGVDGGAAVRFVVDEGGAGAVEAGPSGAEGLGALTPDPGRTWR